MADQAKHDDVESFLADQKAFEDRKQGLTDELLKLPTEFLRDHERGCTVTSNSRDKLQSAIEEMQSNTNRIISEFRLD